MCRFSLYVLLTVSGVRALVYLATLLVKNQDSSKLPEDEISKEFMSDHIFLGICITCLARFELYCCMESLGSNKCASPSLPQDLEPYAHTCPTMPESTPQRRGFIQGCDVNLARDIVASDAGKAPSASCYTSMQVAGNSSSGGPGAVRLDQLQ